MTPAAGAANARPLLRMLSVFAKAAVSAALIWLALRQTDFATVSQRVAAMGLWHALGALTLLVLMSLLAAWRWTVISSATRVDLPFRHAVRYLFIGLFFNQTLPSSVGGDAFRIWLVRRSGASLGTAFANVALDRTIGVSALAITAAMGLPVLFRLVPGTAVAPGIGALAAITISGFGLLVWLGSETRKRLPRWRWLGPVRAVASGARAVALSPRIGPLVLVQSVSVHLLMVVAAATLLAGLGRPVAFGLLLALVPAVLLLAVAPVSLAGWGVREGAMVFALGSVGVPAADAFALSVMLGLGLFAVGLPGGLLWLRSPTRASGPRF